jgi:regulation of enolase protein 1 (concanavalin A-like superfamily)
MILLISVLAAACGAAPAVNQVAPTPLPKPTPPGAIRVDKPINVSFSTYSTDWPVGWEWIDPDEKKAPTPHDTKKRVLRLRIPTGKDLAGERRNAPRYLKAIAGDFQIETRVRFLPKENYQGAGLLIYVDDKNYIRFERAYGGFGGGSEGIRLDVREAGEYRSIVTPREIQTDAGETEMRIVRSGQVFTGFWRVADDPEWRKAGEFVSDYPEAIHAGLVACNTAEEITAEFQYIRLRL